MYSDTLVAIDVEATGLNEFEDEIIEVAAVRFCGGTEIEVFERLVKPTIDIPYKISRLTHITNEMVANAPVFADIRSELREFIGTSPVVGHSIDFDVRMLAGSGLALPQAKSTPLISPLWLYRRLGALNSPIWLPSTKRPCSRAGMHTAHCTMRAWCMPCFVGSTNCCVRTSWPRSKRCSA